MDADGDDTEESGLFLSEDEEPEVEVEHAVATGHTAGKYCLPEFV